MSQRIDQTSEFKELLGIVARREGFGAALAEKDYWLVHVLQELSRSEFKDEFIFKGGTSLSKGWNLIKRFSEDIDLTFFSIDARTNSYKKRRLRAVQEFVSTLAGITFADNSPENFGAETHRTACFKYERVIDDPLLSLKPYLILEMGFREGVMEPNERRPIQSFIGRHLEDAGNSEFGNTAAFQQKCLHPKRTLVEKLFALYAAHAKGKIETRNRDYYDIYFILNDPDTILFLDSKDYGELKDTVALFSKENFKNAILPPENRFKGCEALNPSAALLAKIRRAYENQRDLYYGDPPNFNEIMSRVQKFQDKF